MKYREVSNNGIIGTASSVVENSLHVAVKRGDLALVEKLLAAGADVNARDKDGQTALDLAVQSHYHFVIVEALIAAGDDVNAADEYDETPLHFLAQKNLMPDLDSKVNISIFKALIAAGANVNARDKDGQTPLHSAVVGRKLLIVKDLLEAGADVNAADVYDETPLHYLAQSYVDISDEWDEALLPCLAGKNFMSELGSEFGISIFKALIRAGADVNARNYYGKTPLYSAIEKGNLELVRALLAASADVNARDNKGQTPLCSAIEKGNLELFNVLLAARADANACDNKGQTPLHYLALKNLTRQRNPKIYVQMAKYLVANGADANIDDKNFETPLSLATKSRYSEMIRVLHAAPEYSGGVDNSYVAHVAGSRGNFDSFRPF